MQIRPEISADAAAISALTTEAFRNAPHSDGNEARIVDGLRAAEALTLSLVGVVDDKIVGHIAFSPVLISGSAHDWFGLGPVSVAPGRQGKGVGGALIREGLARLREEGAHGCVVLGDPAYYGRFDFRPDPELTLADVPPEYFMVLRFFRDVTAGQVTYHPAFYP